MINKNEKFERYLQVVEEHRSKARSTQMKIEQNRAQHSELEQKYMIAVVNNKGTAKIKRDMDELDNELHYLELDQKAFDKTDIKKLFKDERDAAYDEQNNYLMELHKQFDSLEAEFGSLREQWLGLVQQAHEIHVKSQAVQSRIIELIGVKQYHAPVGDRNHSRFLYLDKKDIEQIFETGRRTNHG